MPDTAIQPTLEEVKKRKRSNQRIVDNAKDKVYIVCGKKTNKNVWELQQLYENYQMKSTKLLPEFYERIKFMIVSGICRASFSKSVDQNGELFNYVVESIMHKIVPKKDPITGQLTTKYDSSKTNVGAYILNNCYWSVKAYISGEQWCESLLSCSDFLEDYEKASEQPLEVDDGYFKMISSYDSGDSYLPYIQQLLQGDNNDN